jgi:hypothetical protein
MRLLGSGMAAASVGTVGARSVWEGNPCRSDPGGYSRRRGHSARPALLGALQTLWRWGCAVVAAGRGLGRRAAVERDDAGPWNSQTARPVGSLHQRLSFLLFFYLSLLFHL